MGGTKSKATSQASTHSDEKCNYKSYKTVPLAKNLEPIKPKRTHREISARQCILEYAREADARAEQTSNSGDRVHVKNKTPVLGSTNEKVFANGNYGFFASVLQAYNNHWSLRTCPEDWWYTIIYRIAIAIDDNSKNKEVRQFFVSHEGKKKLTVMVGPSVYGIDYSWFLDQMTAKIASNIKVPNYVDVLKSDFTTSTACHVICSQITCMASLQEYFEYVSGFMCGIPSLQMEGKVEDWERLKQKFIQLKKILSPISHLIGISSKWWADVIRICDHLIGAYKGKPDVRWWSCIFAQEPGWGSGARTTYNGWFITELLGLGTINSLNKLRTGIITVPLTLSSGEEKEEAAFAAGIAGFKVIRDKEVAWPSVKAAHGWVLMLKPDSAYRKELISWERRISKAA